MLYYSIYQIAALNQPKESLETLALRKDMIKKRANVEMGWDLSQKNSNFDISKFS